MLLKTCLIFLSLLQSIYVFGQVSYSLGSEQAYIERMEAAASKNSNDSIRANEYFKLSLLYKRMSDTTSSGSYLRQAIGLAKHYPFLKAASSYYQCIVGYVPGEIESLARGLMTSDSLLRRFTQPEAYRIRAVIWNNFGIVQQVKGDEKAALAAYTDNAIHYARQSGDSLVIAKTNKAMAIIFMNANQRDKAALYLKKAVDATSHSDISNPVNLTELIETEIIAAENYLYNNQYDSALHYINSSRILLTPYPSSNLYTIFYFVEGVHYDKTKEHDKAVKSFESGIALSEKLGAPYAINRLKYAKYRALSNLQQYKSAAVVLEDLLTSPYVFTTDRKIYYQELYSTYAKLGDAKRAYQWATEYITLSDSLYEKKQNTDIMELESKYRHAENQQKIAELQIEKSQSLLESSNNRWLMWLSGTVSVFLLVVVSLAFVLYRQKESRYRQKLKETEQTQQIQLAKALMLGEEKERKRLAVELHDGLGGQLAGIKINLSRMFSDIARNDVYLQKVIDQLDVSSNELRRIARNMMPEALLMLGLESALKDMCDAISTDEMEVVFQPFGIDTNLHRDMQMNIYRIVQELLTNAIRHAEASEILVQCSQNESRLFITIEDNGKGISSRGVGTTNGMGMGLSNVQSRVEFLKGKMDISSSAEGTTINIEIDVTA